MADPGKGIRVVGAGVQTDEDRRLPEPRRRGGQRATAAAAVADGALGATPAQTRRRVGALRRAANADVPPAAVSGRQREAAVISDAAASTTSIPDGAPQVGNAASTAAPVRDAQPAPPRRADKAYSGRLGTRTARRVEEFTDSLSVDRRLYVEDIAGSRAHAKMLRAIGVLTAEEQRSIDVALREMRKEFDRDEFVVNEADEDIHMAVERRLTEKIGETGGKLHTARSRNDQVATDLRLWCKRACRELMAAVADLQEALLRRAQEHRASVLPGYTHMQRAQVVSLAHHLLAYVEMLQRDVDRLEDCHERCDVLPLGSGALAGSTLPLQRRLVADELGFDHLSANSLDAVGDRDFVVEITGACSLTMIHLSRFAEELVLWTGSEFGFAELPDAYATGSSLMPQKKNPDVLELIRGRVGRVVGAQVALLITLKALPLAYNRDLQEDKRSLFDAVDTTQSCVVMLGDVVKVLRFDTEAMRAAAADPALMATDIADLLVTRGVPFRDSHRIVGRAVSVAGRRRRTLADLTADEWAAIDTRVDVSVSDTIAELFDPVAGLQRRTVAGGPAPRQVQRQLVRGQALVAKTRRLLTVMAGTPQAAREVGAEARRN